MEIEEYPTGIEKMASDLCDKAKIMAMEMGLGPQEAIGALLTAGIASAFNYVVEGTEMHEMAASLVGFVNAACTNLIEGIENAEEAASNG